MRSCNLLLGSIYQFILGFMFLWTALARRTGTESFGRLPNRIKDRQLRRSSTISRNKSGIKNKSSTGVSSNHGKDNSVRVDVSRRICVITLISTPPANLDPALSGTISRALRDSRKITTLYAHQVSAIKSLAQHRHVIVSTSTASGKSVIYQVRRTKCIFRINVF